MSTYWPVNKNSWHLGEFSRASIFHGECAEGMPAKVNGITTQDYKSLCIAVMICAILVNTHTHTHTHTDRYR